MRIVDKKWRIRLAFTIFTGYGGPMKAGAILAFFILASQCAWSQWDPEIRLTDDPATSWPSCSSQRSIAADGNALHVVWEDERDGRPELYYKRSTDGGISWGVDTRLTEHAAVGQPSIALTGSIVHIVWDDRRNGNNDIYYKRSTDGGTNWEADQQLTTDTSSAYLPSIDAAGSLLHVVWEDDRSGNSEVYYKRSTDGGLTWEVDMRLTDNPAASYFSTVAASGSLVHVAWSDYRDDGDEELYYKRSSDGGATWSPDIRLTYATGWSEWPGIAATDSLIHLVWYDFREGGKSTGQIYYKRSTDAGITWENDVRITANLYGAYMASVAAAGSNVHLVWQQFGDIYSLHSSDAGASWTRETHLTNNQRMTCPAITENPSVALSGSAVHVLWSDRRDGNSELYYRQNPTGQTVSGLWDDQTAAPREILLEQNYPNPFHESTHIRYRLERARFVDITVRDVLGSTVATLVHEEKDPGQYTVSFDGSHLIPGIYFLTMHAGSCFEYSVLCIAR